MVAPLWVARAADRTMPTVPTDHPGNQSEVLRAGRVLRTELGASAIHRSVPGREDER